MCCLSHASRSTVIFPGNTTGTGNTFSFVRMPRSVSEPQFFNDSSDITCNKSSSFVRMLSPSEPQFFNDSSDITYNKNSSFVRMPRSVSAPQFFNDSSDITCNKSSSFVRMPRSASEPQLFNDSSDITFLIYQGVHCCTKVCNHGVLRTVKVVLQPEISG